MVVQKLPRHCLRAIFLFFTAGVLLAHADSKLCDWLLRKKIPLDQEVETLRVLDQGCSHTCSVHAWHVIAEVSAKTPLEITFTVRQMMRSRAILAFRAKGLVGSVTGEPDEAFAVTKAYGAIPESAWIPKTKVSEMDDAQLVNGINSVLSRRFSSEPLAIQAIDNYLDSVFGEIPKTFEFEGKTYNPLGFAQQKMAVAGPKQGIKEVRLQNPNGNVTKSAYSEYSSIESPQVAESIAKTWLDSKAPVMFIYDFVRSDHEDPILNKQFNSPLLQGSEGHAVIITGYLEDLDGRVLAWKVQNSWGKQVGVNGVYFMSPEFFRRYLQRIQVVARFDKS